MIYGVICVKNNESVPLYSRKIHSKFQDYSVIVQEQHYYLYRGDTDVETEFRFPSKECSIFNLKYKIEDNDWITMNVEEKEKASNEYTSSLSKGNQAFLAEESKDMYTIKIGRLQKNERVIMEFSYYSNLDVSTNKLNYRVPITLVPPYMGKYSDDIEEAVKTLPTFISTELPYGIHYSAEFDRSGDYTVYLFEKDAKSYESNNGKVKVNSFTLTGSNDVLVQIKQNTDIKSDCTLYKNEKDTYVQAVFANYDVSKIVKNKEYTNSRFVIVIDGSGSMCGQPIEHAKKAVKLALQELPSDCEYSVAMFGSNYVFHPENTDSNVMVHSGVQCDGCNMYPLKGNRYKCTQCEDYDLCTKCNKNKIHSQHNFTSVGRIDDEEWDVVNNMWLQYNDTNRSKTHEWLDKNVTANYGGTEIFAVLNEAYNRLATDTTYDNNIIFMTDGAVWGQDTSIIDLIKRNSNNVKFYALGIGNGHSEDFINRATKVGNGIARHVYSNDMIEEHTQFLLKCCMKPNIRNVKVVWDNCTVEHTAMKELPVLFYQEPFVVFAKISNLTNNSKVRFLSGDQEITSMDVNKIGGENPLIDRCFSTSYVKQLVENPELFSENKKERINKIISYGIKYGIVTPYTSAIATREIENSDGTKIMKTVDIPIRTPTNFRENVNHSTHYGIRESCSAPRSCSAPKRYDMKGECVRGVVPLTNSCEVDKKEEEMGGGLFGGLFGGMRLSKNNETNINQTNQISSNNRKKQQKLDVKNTIDALLLLQNIDGTWTMSDALLKLLNIDNSTNDPTLLVLAFFWKHLQYRAKWDRAYLKSESMFTKANKHDFETDVIRLSV
jgi:hypothetical protein